MPAAVSALNSVLFPTFGNPTMPASMINLSLANGASQTQEYNLNVAWRAFRVVEMSKLSTAGLEAACGSVGAECRTVFGHSLAPCGQISHSPKCLKW